MDYFQILAQDAPFYSSNSSVHSRRYYEEHDDRGLFNVLMSFAVVHSITVFGDIISHKDDSDGGAFVRDGAVWVRTYDNRLQRCHNLLHEFAHIWSYDCYPDEMQEWDRWLQEQVAELVACRILEDYGYNVRQSTAAYLWAWRQRDDDVLCYDLYNKAEVVYNVLSTDLVNFLKDDLD